MTENICPACGESCYQGDLLHHYRMCNSDKDMQERIMGHLSLRWDRLWMWYNTDPEVVKAWQAASESVRQRWLVQQALAGELHGR